MAGGTNSGEVFVAVGVLAGAEVCGVAYVVDLFRLAGADAWDGELTCWVSAQDALPLLLG